MKHSTFVRHVEVLLDVTQCILYASEQSSVITFFENRNVNHLNMNKSSAQGI